MLNCYILKKIEYDIRLLENYINMSNLFMVLLVIDFKPAHAATSGRQPN